MARSKIASYHVSRLSGGRSLARNLQLLNGAVFVALTVLFVTGYSYVSSRLAHEERAESARALGTTLARLVARPVSMGDYLSVEQSLRGSKLQDFICSIRVVTPDGAAIASVENSKSTLCADMSQAMAPGFPILTVGALDPAGERRIGNVVLNVGLSDLSRARLRSILAALMFGSAILIVLLILNRIAVDWALQPLARAVSAAAATAGMSNQHSETDRTEQALKAAPREIQPLLEELVRLSTAYAKADGDIRVAKVARQVAHDIRSPLAALEMGSSSRNIPETERLIIRQATTRIRDIANDLSGRFRDNRDPSSRQESNSMVIPQLIPVLIDEIVTEMRLRYRSRHGLEITANLDQSNYGLFALVDPASFRRALSNLIQNAVEAIRGDGRVEIRSEANGECAIIQVMDNGQGIPPGILPRLGVPGETFGKPQGSGLGLHYAKQAIEQWQGSLKIESEENQGTTVSLTLPLARPPEWFVPKLELDAGANVVVLDDDQSIHQIWNERLSGWLESKMLSLIHFTSGAEFRAWFKANENVARTSKLLVDFELIGEADTGFSLVKELAVEENTLLITSHYDEHAIRASCEQSRIRLIPKGLAAFVPIHIKTGRIAAVLIDDEKLNHDLWQYFAERTGQRFLTCYSDAEIESGSLARDTPIYVDRNLADGLSGENILKRLHHQGFTRLYLYTGDELTADELASLPFIRGVVGKNDSPEVFGPA